jgi:hypothetical protein
MNNGERKESGIIIIINLEENPIEPQERVNTS